MRTTYIVTGAAGHLGGTIVRLLSQTGQEVRALSLAGETQRARRGVSWYTGDVRRTESQGATSTSSTPPGWWTSPERCPRACAM